MTDDELSFTVSAREIYDKVSETGQLVKEMRDDRLSDLEDARTWRQDVETRLRSLERFRYMGGGGLVLLAAVIGWLVQFRTGGGR